ncbi:MAG: hypothetical protein WCR20_03175 [Verrucomicrobiota bacterium]
MSKQITTSMLALALGATGYSCLAATYNGDLVIGFTSGVGSDLVYDLGSGASLVDGQQWTLTPQLSAFTLSAVNWGIAGCATVGGVRTAWVTSPGGEPPLIPNTSAWGKMSTAVSSIYGTFVTAGAGQYVTVLPSDENSWNQQTINGSLPTQFYNVYENPNFVGTTCASFYRVASPNVAPVLLGTFCLGSNSILTFHTVSTAKPAPKLSIGRSGTVTTISFASTNGAAYTLCATNNAGLGTPTAIWPVVGTTNGNNSTIGFKETNSSPNRVYRVKVQ